MENLPTNLQCRFSQSQENTGRRTNITEADINTIVTEIMKFASDLPSPESLVNSGPPVVRVIHCVLSRCFAVGKLDEFRETEIESKACESLLRPSLLDSWR